VADLKVSFGSTFNVLMANGSAFTNTGDVWCCVEGAKTWTFNDATGTLTLTSVPEPSTFVLFSIGTASLLAYAWRRRVKAA
jgi:hypothetical protein